MDKFLYVLAIVLSPVGRNAPGSIIAELAHAPRWVMAPRYTPPPASRSRSSTSISCLASPKRQRPGCSCCSSHSAAHYRSYSRSLRNRLCKVATGGSVGSWAVYLATAAGHLSDGYMTGMNLAVSAELGLLPARALVAANPQARRTRRLLSSTAWVPSPEATYGPGASWVQGHLLTSVGEVRSADLGTASARRDIG